MIEAPSYPESLEPFFERGLITDEPQVVKSGKEGTVYRCRAVDGTLVAAKEYRPRHMRTFKNDAMYREGHLILDKRLRKAFEQKTRTGREFQFSSWVYREWETLNLLHEAGGDVPRPIALGESAILMEYLGDEEAPAPALKDVRLAPVEVLPQLRRVLDNVELALARDRVHGDLSAFNILYWNGRATIIDFPQAIDPRTNPNAYSLLARDLTNVYDYWSRYGIDVHPGLYVDDLWRRFQRGEL